MNCTQDQAFQEIENMQKEVAEEKYGRVMIYESKQELSVGYLSPRILDRLRAVGQFVARRSARSI